MKKNIRRVVLGVMALSLLVLVVWAAESTNMEIKKGRVYLNLKDADVKTVLQIFAKATNTNIVTSDDVTGKVTVTFTGIEPKAGLEAVLRTKGLDWFEEEGTIFVSTKRILRSYYLENARPSDIAQTIKDILPTGSRVSVDDSYNVLVIQTSSDYLPRLEKLIKELDIPPTQVMIEVRMIQVRDVGGGSTGVDAKYTSPRNPNNVLQTVGFAGRSTDTSAQGVYAHILSGDINAYLSALKTQTNYDTIASPSITTLSNREASLLIGQKLGYKTTVISDQTTTQQVNFLEVGTSLKITPQVSKSGYIRMLVEPKISDGSITNDLPQENTTQSKNEVVVRDGQTFVIGGLTKEKDTEQNSGIPFLMDVPFLGTFFRQTIITKEKYDLLVFVTPHLLTPEFLKNLSNTTIPAVEKKAADMKARLIH
jgi:type IV pilus assembly protein PilQ